LGRAEGRKKEGVRRDRMEMTANYQRKLGHEDFDCADGFGHRKQRKTSRKIDTKAPGSEIVAAGATEGPVGGRIHHQGKQRREGRRGKMAWLGVAEDLVR